MWKEYFTEIEMGVRYAFGCTCAAIGCTIKLVVNIAKLLIAVPDWIAEWLNKVAKLAVRKYQKGGKYIDIGK